MSPDKAELRLESLQVIRKSKNNEHLPRWLLNPIFAARLTAAALVSLGGAAIGDSANSINPVKAAETTTQCTGSITELAFRYFDRYLVDKTGAENLDSDDFVLGPLPRQTVYLYDKDKKPFNPPKSAILDLGPDYSLVHFEITEWDKVNCNYKDSQGRDRATLYLEFETNRDRLYAFMMFNGGTFGATGIAEDNLVRLGEYLMDQNRDIWKVGHKAQLLARIIFPSSLFNFMSEEEMKNDNSAANREVIRKYINNARENVLRTPTPTPTATPIPKPTPTPKPTATETPKPTQISTPTSTVTHTATPIPKPTQTPISEIRLTPFVSENLSNTSPGIPIWLWGLIGSVSGIAASRLYRKWKG